MRVQPEGLVDDVVAFDISRTVQPGPLLPLPEKLQRQRGAGTLRPYLEPELRARGLSWDDEFVRKGLGTLEKKEKEETDARKEEWRKEEGTKEAKVNLKTFTQSLDVALEELAKAKADALKKKLEKGKKDEKPKKSP